MRRRITLLGLVLVTSASGMLGEVKLLVRRDGTKVIYNSPTRGKGSRAADLKWFAAQRDRQSAYDPIIKRHCDEWNVDPILVRAVILVESNFNAATISPKGARGLMQLMPGTARRFHVAKMHDPDENIRGGVQYLAKLLELFPNDLRRALAAYNAGEGAVLRYGGIPPYEETQTYVQRALSAYYGRPYGTISLGNASGGRRLAGGFKSARAPVKIALASSVRPAAGTRAIIVR